MKLWQKAKKLREAGFGKPGVEKTTSGPKVSIIIPMYKAEPYLKRCLESIAEQSFLKDGGSLEVLCCDDGSPDNTCQLAQQLLAELELPGHVYTHPNTGSPAAGRNLGIERAKGEYIFFVDVDDHLDSRALTRMVGMADAADSDVVVGKYVGVGRPAPKAMFKRTVAVTDATKTPALLDSLNMLKLFRTAFLREKVAYRVNPKLQMCEDVPFMLACYLVTDRVSIISKDCYYWVREKQTASGEKHLTQRLRTPEEYWRFVDETLDLIAAAAKEQPEKAARLRELFWNRVLSRTVTKEMRYPRNTADREHAIAVLLDLVERRNAQLAEDCRPAARTMLDALHTRDYAHIQEVALTL